MVFACQKRIWPAWVSMLGVLPVFSQDLEPRRWSHLPTGGNFGGAGYAYLGDLPPAGWATGDRRHADSPGAAGG
jgi:hypothetical protein